ncbi:MAG: SDR family oxidoreductase [Acidobacteria bacterium]|nr:SDR family oxidoreductase [Acidobacteriota bacterium]
MKIKDKIVLVTGGANGIGKALCERFHAEGAEKIFVADREFENAEKVAESVGGKAFDLDVSDEANCRKVVTEILDECGRIDFVASNAGIGGAEGSLEVSDKIWDMVYKVNVLSHVYLARAIFPQMLKNGGGGFMITASAAGLLTHPLSAPYSVTKHAAVAMAENLAIEFGDKIYVSCLCPQGVRTRLIEDPDYGNNTFLIPDSITAQECADVVVRTLEEEKFLILPHAEVGEFIVNKAENRDRWLHSLRKLRHALIGGAEQV